MIADTVQQDAQIRLVPTCGRRPCELQLPAYLNQDPGLCLSATTYLARQCPSAFDPASSRFYSTFQAQQLHQEAFEMTTAIALGSYDYVSVSHYPMFTETPLTLTS